MTFTTPPCMLPYSADAPIDWMCISRMKSMPTSARAPPLQGQVVFMLSMRNRFSLTPDPNTDTVVTDPLDGDVGETPAASRIGPNMLARRLGAVVKYAGPKRLTI